ncbi:hypothetical protein H5410_015349 [Solanum commersonii]|uniref:Uncharacterized protein n=1 Tax=Solanum commersonii TaxID=4109 RepID=A0A9J5ZTA0_SOLCO|nr:hypothetical protein H5410_015349 [Solanum commersonii]
MERSIFNADILTFNETLNTITNSTRANMLRDESSTAHSSVHCLEGDDVPICGSLTGVAALEVDAMCITLIGMAVRKDEFQDEETRLASLITCMFYMLLSEILYCISSETDRSRTWEIQVATYGLDVCAKYGGSAYKSLVGGIRLCKRHPNVVLPENVMAYDNDVSVLGKICNFHRESIDSTQIFGLLLDEVRSIVDEIMQAGEIFGIVIKTFKADFLSVFDELSSYLTPILVTKELQDIHVGSLIVRMNSHEKEEEKKSFMDLGLAYYYQKPLTIDAVCDLL